MKTHVTGKSQRTLLIAATLVLLVTRTEATINPSQITSPANGTTLTQSQVDLQVSVADIPNVQSVKIRSDGKVIGSVAPTSYFGEWSFPDGSHISIVDGTDDAVKIDYSPPAGAPMFLMDGALTEANTFGGTFIHWPGGGVTNTGDATATFSFTGAGLLNVAIQGDSPLGTRNVNGGLSLNTTYHFVWKNPPAGPHSLTAEVVYLINESPATVTSVAVKVNVKALKLPEIVVQQPKGSGLTDGAATGFKVTFKPTAKGSRNAAIRIKRNDADKNPFDIMLTGLGSLRLYSFEFSILTP